ncbi:heparan sulfate glucosamine 3-O-sulfotransferase 1-like isoform X3 [Antedon mediterranea]
MSFISTLKTVIAFLMLTVLTFSAFVLLSSTRFSSMSSKSAALTNIRRLGLHSSNLHRGNVSLQEDDIVEFHSNFAGIPNYTSTVNIQTNKYVNLRKEETKVVENVQNSFFKNITTKYRRFSPGKMRISTYIKNMKGELKRKVDIMIANYDLYNDTPFSSLSSGQMWYVFTHIMKNIGYKQRLPKVINIGVKKSGTTALGFFIGQHPQISHSFGNEVHFFDKHDRFKFGLSYYYARMGFSTEYQIPFEKTPKYFITKNAPKMIFNNLPKDIKFLLCVRDPVKRAVSEYHHDTELMLRHKKQDLQEAKKRTPEEQGKLFKENYISPEGTVYKNKTVISTSIYSVHFKNWLKKFPRDRFLIVDLDNLAVNTFTELKRIEKFLGLETFFTRSMMYKSRMRGSCLKINGAIKCPARSTPGFTNKANLDSNASKILYDFYRPYNKEFSKLIDEQFDWMDL